jgi:hypothetical protein
MLGPTRAGGWPVNEVAYFDDAEWSVTALTDAVEPVARSTG